MRIVAVSAIPFKAPRKTPWQAAFGRVVESEYAIVKIDCDEGFSGIGEIATVWDRQGISQAADVNKVIAPLLIGEDPLALNLLCSKVHASLGKGSNPAKAGVDIALHDLAGKILGVPIYQLLGGRLRDRIGLSFSINMASPEQMADEAVGLTEQGFKALKIKAGRDAKNDLNALRCIRKKIGFDVRLRVDMNAGVQNPKEALKQIRRFEEFDIEFVEQPLVADDIRGMAFLRTHSPIPLMADESVWDSKDALRLLMDDAADLANIYVMEAGGLHEAARALSILSVGRLMAMIGSMPEFSVGTAAQVHLAAASTNIIDYCDTCGFLYHGIDIVKEQLHVADGYVTVPTAAGLGVELNFDIIERLRVQ